ncbi:hypothetical protein DFH06DRAFT_1140299 [Mycena polygramma]|nr:hypothetical protein DFH06DRAFT_1140299 [Mycena polygramma]
MVTKNSPRKAARARRKYKRTPGYVTVSSIADLGSNFTAEVLPNDFAGSEFNPVATGLCNHAVLHGWYEHIGSVKKNLYRNGFVSRFIYKTTNKCFSVLDLIDSRQVSTEQIQRVLSLTCTPHTAPAPPSQLTTGVVSHGSNRRIFITVESDSDHHPSLPPEIMFKLLSPPKAIRLQMPAECQPAYADVIFGMESTVVLPLPTALALHSTLKLFKGKMMCSTSVTPLVPDGIQSGQFRYAASFPHDIWQDLELSQHDGECRSPAWDTVSDQLLPGRSQPEVNCALSVICGRGNCVRDHADLPFDRNPLQVQIVFCSRLNWVVTQVSLLQNTASSDLALLVSRASPDDTIYSRTGTFNKGSAASVVCGTSLKEEVFSPAGVFRRVRGSHYFLSKSNLKIERYLSSVVHRSPSNSDASKFWDKSGSLYSDAGEKQANCAWVESLSATTIHDLYPNHDDNFDQPNICQPSRHAAYSITGEFMVCTIVVPAISPGERDLQQVAGAGLQERGLPVLRVRERQDLRIAESATDDLVELNSGFCFSKYVVRDESLSRLPRSMSFFKIFQLLAFLSALLSTLQQLQSAIVAPLCATPILQHSTLCRAVHQSLNWHWCSAMPFISGTNWCQNIEKANTESGYDSGMLTLVVITSSHQSLSGLNDLDQMSGLSNHPQLSGELKLGAQQGLACKKMVDKYATKFSAALNILIDSTTLTLSIMKPPTFFSLHRIVAKQEFQRTLEIFDAYIPDLMESGNVTLACLSTVDAHIQAADDYITETRRATEQQIKRLRGIWSYLGGNGSHLVEAQERLELLVTAQIRTQIVHTMIWDLQAHLMLLEAHTQVWRTLTASPSLTWDSSRQIIDMLSTGLRGEGGSKDYGRLLARLARQCPPVLWPWPCDIPPGTSDVYRMVADGVGPGKDYGYSVTRILPGRNLEKGRRNEAGQPKSLSPGNTPGTTLLVGEGSSDSGALNKDRPETTRQLPGRITTVDTHQILNQRLWGDGESGRPDSVPHPSCRDVRGVDKDVREGNLPQSMSTEQCGDGLAGLGRLVAGCELGKVAVVVTHSERIQGRLATSAQKGRTGSADGILEKPW